MIPLEIIIFLVIGVVIATEGALLGVGGGFMLVPIFMGFNSMYGANLLAPVLSSFVIIFISLSASSKYGYKKLINYRLGLSYAPFAIAGAFIGTNLLKSLADLRETGQLIFQIIFTVLIVIIGIQILFKKYNESHFLKNDHRTNKKIRSYYWAIPFGCLTGLAAGLTGIGGGIIDVPVIHLFFLETMHVTIATSLFIVIFTASFSTLSNCIIYAGVLDTYFFMAGLIIAAGAIIGSQIGSHIQTRLKGKTLRIIFGFFEVGVALPLLWLGS